MANPLKLAAALYARLMNADRRIKDQLRPFLQDMESSGAVPIGMRRDPYGGGEYLWLVFDRRRLPPAELDRHLANHTPPGLKMTVIYI